MKSKITHPLLSEVGNTPIVKIDTSIFGYPKGNIFLKMENMNPTRTIKDRYAKWILEYALTSKKTFKKTFVDISIGNYGVSLSWFASLHDYQAVIFLPKNIGLDIMTKITKYGGKVVLGKTDNWKELEQEAKNYALRHGYFYTKQFSLEESITCSEKTIGKEIKEYSDENSIIWDAIVMPYGSGATVQGIKRVIDIDTYFNPISTKSMVKDNLFWLTNLIVEKKNTIKENRKLLIKLGLRSGEWSSLSLSGSIQLLEKGFTNILCIISDE